MQATQTNQNMTSNKYIELRKIAHLLTRQGHSFESALELALVYLAEKHALNLIKQ